MKLSNIFLFSTTRNIDCYIFSTHLSRSSSLGFGSCPQRFYHDERSFDCNYNTARSKRYNRWKIQVVRRMSIGRNGYGGFSSNRLYVQQEDKQSILNEDKEDEGYYKIEQDKMFERNKNLMETVNDDEESRYRYGTGGSYTREELSGDFVAPNGFDIDWELEKARRIIEGPAFAPLRMTLWRFNEARKRYK